jgi:hypothetical protein
MDDYNNAEEVAPDEYLRGVPEKRIWWTASRKESRIARTVVLKLKTSEFKTLTRSHTPVMTTTFRLIREISRPSGSANGSTSSATSNVAMKSLNRRDAF